MKQVKKFKFITALVFCLSLFLSVANAQVPHSVFQVSTINAVVQGIYDGEVTIGEMKKHGNFGIGTYDGLDGEMVVLDGKFYHVKSNGEIVVSKDTTKTPFADVVDFKPDMTGEIHNAQSFSEIGKQLDGIINDRNYIYAIRIDGVMNLKTRAIPRKTKPYPTLAEAAKTQSVFDIKNVHGTIVGFWCPSYLSGVNVTGYHLHFISDDRKLGGHILSGSIVSGKVQIERISDFHIVLPSGDAFRKASLNKDFSKELKAAEQSD